MLGSDPMSTRISCRRSIADCSKDVVGICGVVAEKSMERSESIWEE